MRIDPQTLLRGFAKLAAVVLVAGLVGAGLGIALAKLSGNDDGETTSTPAAAGVTTAAEIETQPPETTTADTETTASEATDSSLTRVQVLSALLGRTSRSTGRALVAARVRVTNRSDRTIRLDNAALLSGQDEIPANESGASDALFQTLTPSASSRGTLRFTLSREITERLNANPSARLRIAERIVTLNLTRR